MADLTENAYIKILGEARFEEWYLDVSAAQTIYQGQPMIIDQSVDTVNLRAYVDATAVVATDVFIGIAYKIEPGGYAVATTDSETIKRVYVLTWPTIVGFKSAVYTNADLGKTVYMSDSAVLSATATANPQIGKLHRVEDGYAFVQLISPQVCTGA